MQVAPAERGVAKRMDCNATLSPSDAAETYSIISQLIDSQCHCTLLHKCLTGSVSTGLKMLLWTDDAYRNRHQNYHVPGMDCPCRNTGEHVSWIIWESCNYSSTVVTLLSVCLSGLDTPGHHHWRLQCHPDKGFELNYGTNHLPGAYSATLRALWVEWPTLQTSLAYEHARWQQGFMSCWNYSCEALNAMQLHVPGASIAKLVFETPSEAATVRSRCCQGRCVTCSATNGLRRLACKCDDRKPKSSNGPKGGAIVRLCDCSIVMPPNRPQVSMQPERQRINAKLGYVLKNMCGPV